MRKIGSVLLPALLCSVPVMAAIQPAKWYTADGVGIVPSIEVMGLYDSNLTNRESDQIASWGTIVSPAISAVSEQQKSAYYASYRLIWGDYADSSADNFVDHKFGLSGDWKFSVRHHLNLRYDFQRNHDQRGEGISSGVGGTIDEPVRYRLNALRGLYDFGAASASAQVQLEALLRRIDYENFRDFTQFRDRNALQGNARFFYRLSSATRILAELGALSSDYQQQQAGVASRDFNDLAGFVGADWEISGKTKGRAKLGWQRRKFDQGEREQFSGLSWSLAADWSPRSYSHFTLAGSRQAKAPEQGGDVIDNDKLSVDWEHYWLQRLATDLTLTYSNDDYVGLERKDTLYEGRVGIRYQFRRWLEVSLWQLWRDKDSNQSGVSYDKQVTSLKIRMSL